MRTRYLWLLGVGALAGSAPSGRPAAPPAAPGGTISGKVTYTGTPPKMKPIDMAKEPACAQAHAGAPVLTENAVTGPGNALKWVVVYVSAGDQPAPPPAEPVRYDQKGCQYIPHVAAMQVNQPLDIYNVDPSSHNIHPLARVKPEFIPVKCNIHPWMHGWFVVLATPHYAVTGDDGAFTLAGLPPGKYTVTAWHEQFGTQSQEVTISDNETKTVNFTLKATPY